MDQVPSCIEVTIHQSHPSTALVHGTGGSSFCFLCAANKVCGTSLNIHKRQAAKSLQKMIAHAAELHRVATSTEFVPFFMSGIIKELSVESTDGDDSLPGLLLELCPALAPYCSSHPKCFFDIVVQCHSISWKQCHYLLVLLGALLQHRSCVLLLLEKHRDFISHLLSGLDYPDEEIKSAVSFVLLKLAGQPEGITALEEVSSVLCRAIVDTLTKAQSEALQTNITALMFVFASEEKTVLLESLLDYPLSPALKTIILSPNVTIQISAIQILATIFSHSETYAASMINDDILDYLVEAMHTSSELLIKSLYTCISISCTNLVFYEKVAAILEPLMELTVSHLIHQPYEVKKEAVHFMHNLLEFCTKNKADFDGNREIESCWNIISSNSRAIYGTITLLLESDTTVDPEFQKLIFGTLTNLLESFGAQFLDTEITQEILQKCTASLNSKPGDEITFANLALVEQVTRSINEQIQSIVVAFCEQTLLSVFLNNCTTSDDPNLFMMVFTIFSNVLEFVDEISRSNLASKLAQEGLIGKSITMLNLFHEELLQYAGRLFLLNVMKAICQFYDDKWADSIQDLPATEKDLLLVLEQKSSFTTQDPTSNLQATIISLLYSALLYDDMFVKCENLATSLQRFAANHDVELPNTELSRQIVFIFVYCSTRWPRKATPREYSLLLPFISGGCSALDFAHNMRANKFLMKWLLQQEPLFEENKKLLVRWLLSLSESQQIDEHSWLSVLVEQESNSIKMLVSLLSHPAVQWLDSLLRVINTCMEHSQTLVALFAFHGVIAELTKLLSLRSTLLSVRSLDLVVQIMLQIVRSLPHNNVNSAEPHLLSQYMSGNMLVQITSLLVREVKAAAVRGQDIDGVLLDLLNFMNIVQYCATLANSGGQVLANEALWLLSVGVPSENLKIKSASIMLLIQILRRPQVANDRMQVLDFMRPVFGEILKLLDANLPILKVLACHCIVDYHSFVSADLTSQIPTNLEGRDLFLKALNLFTYEVDEVIRNACVRLMSFLATQSSNLAEQPWLRFTVESLLTSTEPLSKSEINLLSIVFHHTPYWLPEIMNEQLTNITILKLAKVLDVHHEEASSLLTQLEKLGYLHNQDHKRERMNSNGKTSKPSETSPWVFIEGVLLVIAYIYK